MIIAFELNGQTAVMHYLAEDTSDEAISAEIARAHCVNSKWWKITKEEYRKIRSSRPAPKVTATPIVQQEAASSGIVAQASAPVLAPEDTAGRLALAVAIANYAIQAGCEAGDYRWHGGDQDFEWGGQRYDAPGLIEYAKVVLR